MKTLHLIGNAHIDPVWLWRWQEGFQEIKATFRSALDRLAEYPDFLFVASSAAFFEWVEENDPAMFREIRERVAEGRWEIVGGFWIEPDCNLVGGESLVRQALLGQRWFEAHLGVTARVGYNPDSFGHSAMMPQLLAQSGLSSYVFLRPGPAEKELPGRVFWWEAPDGSRVLTLRIPYEYCTGPEDIEPHIRRCADEIAAPLDELMCFYGVGNHGGGPTRRNLESIRTLQAAPDLPRLVLSTPERYFAAIAGRTEGLPVVRDELQHHARGCYAAHSGIKRWNRQTEQALLCAEKWCSVASSVAGQPYPEELERGWKDLLFCQFHDILGGTSIKPAYDDARDLLGEAAAIAGRGLNRALQAIAWRVSIPAVPDTRPLVAFNPHPWPAQLPVELELAVRDGEAVVDEAGRAVPAQVVRSLATLRTRRRICFLAELPALGYRLFRVGPGEQSFPEIAAGQTWIENEAVRVEVDPASGCPSRLLDRRSGRELLASPARAVVLDDPSDTWSHKVDGYRTEVGVFADACVRLVEQGPVRAVLRSESSFRASRLIQEVVLYHGLELVEVRVQVDWREQLKVLKLRFPLALSEPTATFEIPYGHIVRPASGDEEPGLSWVDVSGLHEDGGRFGMSLLNDAKHSFDVKGADLGLTVLRSPIYAHHDPYRPPPEERCEHLDQGWQDFRYALLLHQGSWREAGTVRRAAELNQPSLALLESAHGGSLAPSQSFLEVSGGGVVGTALKRAEDGEDLIVRVQEAHGEAARARVRLPAWGRDHELDLGPHQIATLRIPRDPAAPIRPVDLLERPV